MSVLCFEASVQMLLIYWCLDNSEPINVERTRKQFIVIVEMKIFTICNKVESDSECICLWNEQQKLAVHSELLFWRPKNKLCNPSSAVLKSLEVIVISKRQGKVTDGAGTVLQFKDHIHCLNSGSLTFIHGKESKGLIQDQAQTEWKLNFGHQLQKVLSE